MLVEKHITSLILNLSLTVIEQHGGKPKLDERGRDLCEAIERFVKDSFCGHDINRDAEIDTSAFRAIKKRKMK